MQLFVRHRGLGHDSAERMEIFYFRGLGFRATVSVEDQGQNGGGVIP